MIIPYEKSSIRNLISVIPLSIWIISLVFFVGSSLYMKMFDGLSWSQLLLLNVQLLTGHSWYYKRVGKIILLSVIFYCFCLDNLYVTNLGSVLTVSNLAGKLTTIDELAKTPYTFLVETTFEKSIQSLREQSMKSLTDISRKTIALSPEKYLNFYSQCRTDQVYFNIERVALHHNELFGKKAQRNCFYILPEYASSSNMGYFYPLGSPLMHNVDRIIQAIVEAGLARHLFYPNSTRHHDNYKELKKIAMVNVLSSFYLLGFGLTSAFIVFLIEIRLEIVKKIAKYQVLRNVYYNRKRNY